MLRKLNSSAMSFNESSASRNISIVIILFGLFLLFSIWIGLYYKVQSERQLEIDNAIKDVSKFTRAFEEHTVRTIKGADQTLLSLKHQYEKEGRNIDIPRYAKDEGVVSQPVLQLSVADENGQLFAGSLVPFIAVNIKDREHFLVHKDVDRGQLFVSKPVFGRASQKWSIQISRRINKLDGSFAGVAVVSVDPFYFSEFYKQVDLGGDSSIALIGRDGIVRVRQDGQEVSVGQDFTNSIVMKKLLVGGEGHFIAKSMVDGIERIYSYRALDEYPLVVVVGVTEEEVFKDLNKRVRGYYWVAGMSTIVIIIFIVMLLVLIERQKKTGQALKQARDGLEVKVGQRTQELFAANQELTAMNEEHIAMNEELQYTNKELEDEIVQRSRIQNILRTSEEELVQRNTQLAIALQDIELAQNNLIQQGKLAGIGQLAAGVAHEINNPLGFVTSNVEVLEEYFNAFSIVFAQYRELRSDIAAVDDPQIIAKVNQIVQLEKEQDLDYILTDIPDLFPDTRGGLNRMSKIVKGMGLFARVDHQQVFERYDLNKGLENTLLVAHNEIKHNATVEEHFGKIPEVEAIGGEINQVLLNLIFNAVQAIKEKYWEKQGTIKLSTWRDEQSIYCAIEDDGAGIKAENLGNIFNPFFTTKPVGQGTGMGLSISYKIIVNRHHGEIMVESELGKGTKFIIKLPIKHDLFETIKNSET